MAEITLPELKPATDADLAVASRKAVSPKASAPAEAPPSSTPEPLKPSASAPASSASAPIAEPKKDDAPKGDVPMAPVEKPRGKSKKPVETFIKQPSALEEVKPTDIPEPLKLEIEKYKSKASEAEKLLSDPDIQILLEAKKTNKDIFSILDEVKGVDPKSVPLVELKKMELLEQGLSDEEMESELEEFLDLPLAKQKLQTNAQRRKLDAEQSTKKQTFLSRLRDANTQSDAEAMHREQLYQKTQNEFLKLCDDYVGKNHYGLTGTPQMAESLKNILQNPDGLIGKNQDGSLNAAELFELAHFKLYKNLLIEELKNSGYAEAYEELEKEFSASGGNTSVVRMPQGAGKMTEHEQGKALLSNAVPVR